ncbi:hypothetical protein A1O1_03641 [Capronia coronata CBS 617.96]|uniref:Uncharacterized protein n=1 Tax=Capronia coronata CBS 617.96 TaxID=1182541 RepID=W9YDD4_9EURO|nr:uncharacterized protein A1O1_03641 [Capronia coronata CBS 617.96]EXJ90538.1 hypothetical protein A1O1_03641 [Capronia coronata CBS 617.96]
MLVPQQPISWPSRRSKAVTKAKAPAVETIPQETDSGSSSSSEQRDVPEVQVPSPRAGRKVHHSSNVKFEVMLLYLRQQQLEKRWADDNSTEGVILKRGKDDFICQPADLPRHVNGFFDETKKLNVKVAMTVRTSAIRMFLEEYQHPFVPFSHGQQLHIIDNISALSFCKRHHYAAFVRSQGMLVVWDEDPTEVVSRAERIERLLVNMLWSMDSSDDELDPIDVEKKALDPSRGTGAPDRLTDASETDEEEVWDKPRKTVIYQAFLVACVSIITIFCLAIGWRQIATEIKIDKSYSRLAILVPAPLQLWLGWFFFTTLVNGVSQIIGPVKQLTENSRFYSAMPPVRLTGVGATLPHVTIQCPVYKEGLDTVIHPTVVSLNKAISTYELQGGSANIFVNDDGMQIISEDDARRRIQYYEDNSIGWVARPKHAPKGDADGKNVFIRAGKFKKASNMNFCLAVSNRIEDKMAEVVRAPTWNQEDEYRLYHSCFDQVLAEDSGRTWAGGDIRVGDYILLVDSDTRVPQDCLLDAVSEMESAPEVAIIQFSSGVLNVTTSFFERAITFFTNLVYTAIRFAVANGDVAAFVGHNAMLRWSAVQDVGYIDDKDGIEKFWSENTVSEDFDMALRLQAMGYIMRFCTYYGDGFKEGVSLTVYDELSRWEKYSYGCAELLFNPFRYWVTRGPITPLFRRFITSRMSLMAKLTILAYVGTYFAIASAWPLTLMNYFLIGWFNGYLDHAYVTSFEIYFGIVVVFQGLGTVSLAVLRYRVENRSLVGSLLENFTWLLLLTVYLGGISMHISQAILCYLFSINMTWGATAKEAERTSFFREVPVILKKFKFTFCYCIVMIIVMIVMAGVGPLGALVPHDWRITTFTAIFPLAILVAFHFLLPLVLNPGLMQFTF